MAIEVTDEMRQAVYAADCERLGHMFDTSNVIGGATEVNPVDMRHTNMLRARDAAKLPHITCSRCTQVWLILDDPGFGYDDAVAKLAARLKVPADQVKPGRRVGIEAPFPPGPDGKTAAEKLAERLANLGPAAVDHGHVH